MDDLYDLVIHPRLLERLARKAYDSARRPAGVTSKELHAARWALEVLRQGREGFFDGKRLGRSDKHVDLRDCAEIKIPVVQEYNSRGRPFGPSHRMIYREYELPGRERPVREVISFAPRVDGLPFKLAGDDLDRPIGMELDDLEGVENTPPAIGREPSRATSPVRTKPSPDVAAALAARLRRGPCEPRVAIGWPTQSSSAIVTLLAESQPRNPLSRSPIRRPQSADRRAASIPAEALHPTQHRAFQ